MDRISALRNVEDALAEFERGEIDLAELEARVGTVLRTYATDFSADETAAYRVHFGDRSHVLVADSPGTARERGAEIAGEAPTSVERLSEPSDPE